MLGKDGTYLSFEMPRHWASGDVDSRILTKHRGTGLIFDSEHTSESGSMFSDEGLCCSAQALTGTLCTYS
jgi:hypothetical protein